jgi:preprotein translocase subunit SecG
MVTFLTGLHIVVCIFLIIVVLLQAGKGGGMGIAFGGGGSQTVFGSSGAGNFLTKLTSATAFIFLVTSLGLAHYSSQQDSKRLQRLAERKAEEKKVEDAKTAQLKSELDKAREAAKKAPASSGDMTVPNQSELPAPGLTPPLKLGDGKSTLKLTPPQATPTKTEKKTEKKAEKPGAKAGGAATEGATPQGDTEAPKPKKKRRAAPPAEGDTGAAPAAPAPPAEAPAPPAQ